LQFTAGDPAGPTKIHVLGLLIMQYPQGSPWERVFGWRFIDPWEAVEPYARGLPDGEMLVILSHVGLSLDTELAKRVPRIDLLLGGHSHDTLKAPRYVGDVPIVHAGPYGRFVSRSELGYDARRRRFTLADFTLVPLLNTA
jgi:2',3'-cyclic-nucleotide 2'-phosphodiesterase (5'-nucleotidase family)